MLSKHILAIMVFTIAAQLASGESLLVPQTAILATVPTGWSLLPMDGLAAVIRGPGRAANSRLTLATAVGDPTTVSASLRSSLLRVATGCQILDDDELPIGGRVWRRLRARFAIGPVSFGQSAWIGTVSGRTLIVILSAPEDELPLHLATAAGILNSLRSAP